jgi:putative ATP-dependent endonuclease of the OLD family
VITDWDPGAEDQKPLGYNRTLNLVSAIELAKGKPVFSLIRELKSIAEYDPLCDKCEEFGVFNNIHTLEVDLFKDGFASAIIETLREGKLSDERKGWVDKCAADADKLDAEKLLTLVEAVGKGRFAQRLATRIGGLDAPGYIGRAIKFVADRV